MNAAASSGNGGFGFGGQSANEGYAIPIEDALDIAKQIQSGDGTDTIHVGAHAGQSLGVSVDRTANGYGDPFGGNGDFGGRPAARPAGNGAYVDDVQSGSGADDAGIEPGDTIVGIDGTTVSSAPELTHRMVKYSARRRGRGRVDRLLGPEPHRHDRARVGSPRLTRASLPRTAATCEAARCMRRHRIVAVVALALASLAFASRRVTGVRRAAPARRADRHHQRHR